MGQSCKGAKGKTPSENTSTGTGIKEAPADPRGRKEAYEKKISFTEATSAKEIVKMVTSEDMFEYLILGRSLKTALKKINPRDNEEIITAIKEIVQIIDEIDGKLHSSYKYPETCKLVIEDMRAIFAKKFSKYDKFKKENRKREACINILRVITEVYNILKFYKTSNKQNSDINKWWSDAKFMNNFNIVSKRFFLEAAGEMELDRPDNGYPPSERSLSGALEQNRGNTNSKKPTLVKNSTTDDKKAEAEKDAKIFVDEYIQYASTSETISKKLEEMIDQEIKNMDIDDNHSASACKGYSIKKKAMKKTVK
jgi:hypothetical protein